MHLGITLICIGYFKQQDGLTCMRYATTFGYGQAVQAPQPLGELFNPLHSHIVLKAMPNMLEP